MSILRSSLRLSSLFRAPSRPQVRNHWNAFIEKKRDPVTGKVDRVDPSRYFLGCGFRYVDPSAPYLLEYEKPWMKRKRMKLQKIWKKRETTVKDLIGYIQIKRDLGKKR